MQNGNRQIFGEEGADHVELLDALAPLAFRFRPAPAWERYATCCPGSKPASGGFADGMYTR